MRWRWRFSDALREGQSSTKVLALLVQKYNTDARIIYICEDVITCCVYVCVCARACVLGRPRTHAGRASWCVPRMGTGIWPSTSKSSFSISTCWLLSTRTLCHSPRLYGWASRTPGSRNPDQRAAQAQRMQECAIISEKLPNWHSNTLAEFITTKDTSCSKSIVI